MSIWKKSTIRFRPNNESVRILFVSDLHGADLIFRKSLQAVSLYDVSVLILSGDLAAKDIRPIIDSGNGTFLVNYKGKNEILDSTALKEVEEDLALSGHYCFRCRKDEFEHFKADDSRIYEILDHKILEKLDSWAKTIMESVDLTKVTVFITPGNDDILEIDELLASYEQKGIHSNLKTPFRFTANEMITIDYSNPTPWHTPRELNEADLGKLIQRKIDQLINPEKAIFNFHCPPINTKIDLAPELDKNLKPVIIPGFDNKIHVGSIAVRHSLETYQPIVSLHGHIHESPGTDYVGKTLCVNPGSEYWNGILHGYIMDIDAEGAIQNHFRIEG